MAQRNLRLAADAVERHADRAAALGVTGDEPVAWRAAARAVLIPFDADLGVHPQAEGFTQHELWDFDNTAPEHYPLLLHAPYVDLYRKQVVKQADLVLAMHLRGDAFSAQAKARNFAYYEALTVRDSSLSACTQAVIAAEVGHLELAYDYFAEAALMDLHDLQHNTRDGLHIAALAGSWIVAVAGFAGMRDHDGALAFAPRLPPRLTRLAFGICFRGRRLRVEVTHDEARYRLSEGPPLQITHHGERLTVTSTAAHRPIPAIAAGVTPRQPPGRGPAQRPVPAAPAR
jgi:alpha,alpha-trehalose phosphorylase